MKMNVVASRYDIKQFCTFRISGYLYGINIQAVKEINQEFQISPVPHSSNDIRGLVNIRGEIYLIFDLRQCFGFDRIELEADHRIVLLKHFGGECSGMLIDQIEDVVTVPSNRIEPYNSELRIEMLKATENLPEGSLGESLIKGVHQLPNEVMVILDVSPLIKEPVVVS